MKRTLLRKIEEMLSRYLKLILGYHTCFLFIILICAGFRYAFINTCIGKACSDPNGNISGSILAVGALLLALVALFPMFWSENRLKNAKGEVRQQVVEEVRKEVTNLVNAHLLLFRVHHDSKPGQLLADQGDILQAITLDPSIKKQEYPVLGERFAKTALELNGGALFSRPWYSFTYAVI